MDGECVLLLPLVMEWVPLLPFFLSTQRHLMAGSGELVGKEEQNHCACHVCMCVHTCV